MRTRLVAVAVVALAVVAVIALASASDDESRPPAAQTAATAPAVAERPISACGRLTVRDGRIHDRRGKPVALRGVNAFAQSVDGGLAATELQDMRDAGFNVVRLVDYWDVLEPRPPRGGQRQYDERAFTALDATVAAAGQVGMYVVLDPVHLFEMSPAFGGRGIPAWIYEGRGIDVARARGELATDPVVRRNLDPLLRRLAARYAEDPTVVAIDPVNEPPSPDVDAIVAWYAHMIGVIRKEAPETMIVVEPRFGDHDMRGVDLTPLAGGENLVLSPHFYYAGGAGDGYDENGLKNGRYVFDGQSGYPESAVEELRRHLDGAAVAARKAGMALWVGEFGIGRQQPGAEAYVRDTTRVFAEAGAGWAYWIWRSEDGFTLNRIGGELSPLLEPLGAAARERRSPAGTPLRCQPR